MSLYPNVTGTKEPTYLSANESLDAVVKGLDVNETDNIIAICGSGDQAFAMLEYANSVFAVDFSREQVEYALYRLESLKKGNISEFLAPMEFCDITRPNALGRNKAYFEKEGRIERIRQKIDKIKIIHENIFSCSSGDFNKAYLSNAFGYCENPEGKSLFDIAKDASRLVIPNGRLYIAARKFLYTTTTDEEMFFDKIMKREKALTEIARKHETEVSDQWKPIVYRRRA